MCDIDLNSKCREIRKTVVKMAHDSKSSHIGSALSCVEILVALFWDIMTKEDRFIMSKGHGCMSYYAVLEQKGILPKGSCETYLKNGSLLSEHPIAQSQYGIDISTGSLGHGLSLSLGAALARKIKNKKGFEFCLLGDGECNEGSIWEAALIAANLKVNNLIAIVDWNHMQAAGFLDYKDFVNKFASFGWISTPVCGHDIKEIAYWIRVFTNTSETPGVLIANTIKGKGISFMENNLEWHYRWPNDQELKKALEEIGD
jgi:transketolase